MKAVSVAVGALQRYNDRYNMGKVKISNRKIYVHESLKLKVKKLERFLVFAGLALALVPVVFDKSPLSLLIFGIMIAWLSFVLYEYFVIFKTEELRHTTDTFIEK